MIIAFDEAGNTGENLLDSQQKIYSLASVLYNESETNQLLSIFTTKSNEIHFVNLRRRYKEQLIEFLNHDLIDNTKVKYSISDKNFELIARLVDYLIEPVFYDNGINMYKDNMHINTCIMLYGLSKTEKIGVKINNLLFLFQKMIRTKLKSDIKNFYDFAKSIQKEHKNDSLIDSINESQNQILSIIESINKYSIDPALPALLSLSNLWYYELKKGFNVIHDNSKQIDYWKELIAFFSNKDLVDEKELSGMFGRSIKFPFQINQLELADSKSIRQIQVADVIASSLSYAFNKIAKNELDDLSSQILESKIMSFKDIRYFLPTSELIPKTSSNLNHSLKNIAYIISKSKNL